jgi:AraC-like DNA-binding protein
MGKNRGKEVKREFYLKGMVCNCCVRLVRQELDTEGIVLHDVQLGKVVLSFNTEHFTAKKIEKIFSNLGFEVLVNRENQLVEQIRNSVIELVHHTTENAMIRNSDYLVGKFGVSYQYLSSLFSKHSGTTLEKYIILQKIEKVKELISYGELTLSEIAYMMGYSSVQYLSTQFKTITGISVTDYKAGLSIPRQSLDSL